MSFIILNLCEVFKGNNYFIWGILIIFGSVVIFSSINRDWNAERINSGLSYDESDGIFITQCIWSKLHSLWCYLLIFLVCCLFGCGHRIERIIYCRGLFRFLLQLPPLPMSIILPTSAI